MKVVKLVHDSQCEIYMKGLLQTKDFLKSILDKEVGLRTGVRFLPILTSKGGSSPPSRI